MEWWLVACGACTQRSKENAIFVVVNYNHMGWTTQLILIRLNILQYMLIYILQPMAPLSFHLWSSHCHISFMIMMHNGTRWRWLWEGARVCVCARTQRYDSISVSWAIWIHETHLMQSSATREKNPLIYANHLRIVNRKQNLHFFLILWNPHLFPVENTKTPLAHKQRNWKETVQIISSYWSQYFGCKLLSNEPVIKITNPKLS